MFKKAVKVLAVLGILAVPAKAPAVEWGLRILPPGIEAKFSPSECEDAAKVGMAALSLPTPFRLAVAGLAVQIVIMHKLCGRGAVVCLPSGLVLPR